MTLELVKDGYAQIEGSVRKIENMASDGASFDNTTKDMVDRFWRIVAEARKLRQTLQELVLLVPAATDPNSGGSAA
ncbi:MAG: hypothetical protein FWD36_03270 [Treponema sp.]|nr:hypothetical protein [Treponema sp.]